MRWGGRWVESKELLRECWFALGYYSDSIVDFPTDSTPDDDCSQCHSHTFPPSHLPCPLRLFPHIMTETLSLLGYGLLKTLD